MAKSTIQRWIATYLSMEVEGLKPTSRENAGYSSELKNASVADSSIRSVKPLWAWIVKYISHEERKPSRTGGKKITTKGRKTTFDERVEIVKYCIEHDRNYSQPAQKYGLSTHTMPFLITLDDGLRLFYS